jgi:hypothetical protein
VVVVLLALVCIVFIVHGRADTWLPSSSQIDVQWASASQVPRTKVIDGKSYNSEEASAACETSTHTWTQGDPDNLKPGQSLIEDTGARCLEERLAWDPSLESYVWAVAIDPPGGKYVIYEDSLPPREGVGKENFDVILVNVYTGKIVDAISGYDGSLPAFPK